MLVVGVVQFMPHCRLQMVQVVQVVVDRAVLFHRQREMVETELLILVVGAAAAVRAKAQVLAAQA